MAIFTLIGEIIQLILICLTVTSRISTSFPYVTGKINITLGITFELHICKLSKKVRNKSNLGISWQIERMFLGISQGIISRIGYRAKNVQDW